MCFSWGCLGEVGVGCGAYIDDRFDNGHDGVDNGHKAGCDGRDQRVELGGVSGLFMLMLLEEGKRTQDATAPMIAVLRAVWRELH